MIPQKILGKGLRIAWKLFGLVLLLTGCAQGVIGTIPDVPDPTRAATIVVARPFYFGGFAATYPITIDGVEVCELGMEEHVVIPVPIGERLIGIKTWDHAVLFSRIHPTQTIQAEAGRTYYFLVKPGRIDRATEEDGRDVVAKTKPLARER